MSTKKAKEVKKKSVESFFFQYQQQKKKLTSSETVDVFNPYGNEIICIYTDFWQSQED